MEAAISAQEAPLEKIGDSEWVRSSTVHPRPYPDDDDAFSAFQEELIDGDLESLHDDRYTY